MPWQREAASVHVLQLGSSALTPCQSPGRWACHRPEPRARCCSSLALPPWWPGAARSAHGMAWAHMLLAKSLLSKLIRGVRREVAALVQ